MKNHIGFINEWWPSLSSLLVCFILLFNKDKYLFFGSLILLIFIIPINVYLMEPITKENNRRVRR